MNAQIVSQKKSNEAFSHTSNNSFRNNRLKGGIQTKVNYKPFLVVSLMIVVLSFSLTTVMAIQPDGASISAGTPQTANTTNAAGSNAAYAGNVTYLSVSGYSTTQAWQGYYGNVTGAIRLGDASNNILYNWTLVNPSGEIYASTNNTITWTNIQCFNFTANGTNAGATGETAGATNLGGINLTTLENRFNIASDDADGVNETFTLIGGNTHNEFFTASNNFTLGECRSTRVYDSSGTGVDNNFEEVLLYEPVSTSVVFATILDINQAGFNSGTSDFQMLVLEDGHGANIATTTYYFFVELE